MLRARGSSLSERRDIIVKRCKGYVGQLQGKNPFKMSTNDIRALIIKSLSCDDTREKILSFRDELAVSCMEEILQMLEGTSPVTPQEDVKHESRFKLRRLLVRLSKASTRMPDSLFLTGVYDPGKYASAGGGYSDVYLATLSSTPVALKRLRIFQHSTTTGNAYEGLCREALLWQQLKHPYILPFLGVDQESYRPYYCLVTPWMNHGNILHYMDEELSSKRTDPLPLARWYSEIIEGLQYLHHEHIIHGDLRGANILIGSDRSVRVGDFGMSQFGDSSSTSFGSRCGGAVRWMAPEILRGERLSYENDVYMFGCLWTELFTRRRPFYDIPHDFQVIAKKLENTHPTWPPASTHPRIPISPGDWEFILPCWDADTSKRPSTLSLAKLCSTQYHNSLFVQRKDVASEKAERKSTRDPFSPMSFQYSPNSSFGTHLSAEKKILTSVSPSIFNSDGSSPFSIVSNGVLSSPSTFSSRDGYVLVA
ncbi:hypothetical protein QCA50_017972 [Cerrena zonata]|uniref:Protein kinase domain-containing protein n=1 Tax=Cerrena zonata TaxID=2478898 RepID=A0AAW0FC16_9APHY